MKTQNKFLVIIIVIITFQVGCFSEKQIIGSWKIKELTAYPISISGFGDILLDSNSRVDFREDGYLHIYLEERTKNPEIYPYYLESKKLIIVYSDFGIPLNIVKISSNELELSIKKSNSLSYNLVLVK